MPRLVPIAAAIALLAASPTIGAAQADDSQTAEAPVQAAESAVGVTPGAPFIDAGRIGFHLELAAEHPTTAIADLRPPTRQNETLMIVGGAAILTGALIDEHVITVAGALIGLYGLFMYLS